MLLAVLVTVGLAHGPARAEQAAEPPSAATAPAIDSERTSVPLEKIEPQPPEVKKPDGLSPLSARAAQQIATAQTLIDEQRFTEAAIELERALRYDPNHPAIHRALARLHWHAGNLQRARTHATRALEVNPDNADAHYLMGRCEAAAGDHEAAILAFRTALGCSDLEEQGGTAALVHYYLAEALDAEDYLEAALGEFADFERVVSGVPLADQKEELSTLLSAIHGSPGEAKSRIYEKLGRYGQAADSFAPVAAEAPEDADVTSRYARLLAMAARYEEALKVARAMPADDETVVRLLSEIHERAGNPQGIVDDLRARLADHPDQPDVVTHLADALRGLGQSAEARETLERFLEGNPEHHTARMRLIELLLELGEWEEALRRAADGIRQSPNRADELADAICRVSKNDSAVTLILEAGSEEGGDPTTDYLRGVVAAAADREEPAERLLRRSLDRAPTFIPTRVAMGRLYLKRYRYDDALRVAARTDENVAEDARLELILGRVYERLDDLEQAELHFKAAVPLNRTDTEAALALAKVYRRSGERLRAQRQLKAILDGHPSHEEARETLAFLYLDESKSAAAVEELQELRKSAPTATTRARAGALLDHLEQQDPKQYRQTLLTAMEAATPDATTWLYVAESYNEHTESADARKAYERVLELDPENEAAQLGIARIDQKLLDFKGSIVRLEQLLQRRPNRHAWRAGSRDLRGLIELYQALGDYDAVLAVARGQDARTDLEENVRAAYRFWIIRTLRLKKQEKEALAQLEAWVKAEPDNRLWSGRLAEEYLVQEQPDSALQIFEAAFRANPDDLTVLNEWVDGLVRAKQFDRALQQVLDRFYQDPGDDRALMLLIYVLAAADRQVDARELIRNHLLTTLNRERFQDLQIELLRRAEQHDEEIAFIDSLLNEAVAQMEHIEQPGDRERKTPERHLRRPDEPFSLEGLHARVVMLRLQMAAAYLGARRYREAQEQMSSWVEVSREPQIRFQYLRWLALCAQAQGDEKTSAEFLERAALLIPDDVGVNNDLAYTWTDQGIRLDQAEQMIRYALWQSPSEGAYLDTYGWLLYKKGAFTEAKSWLLRSKSTAVGDDPVVLDHLGDTCWRLGEPEEALEYWQAAVEAVKKRDEDELIGVDVHRVREGTPKKLEAAQAGEQPDVAPLAQPSEKGDTRT